MPEVEEHLNREFKTYLEQIIAPLAESNPALAGDSLNRYQLRMERSRADYKRVAQKLAPGSPTRQQFLDALNNAPGYEVFKSTAPVMLQQGEPGPLYIKLEKLMIRKLQLIGDRADFPDQYNELPQFFKVLWTADQINDITTLILPLNP